MKNRNTLIYKLSLISVVLAAVVVLLGAYTRLVDAGLGCPDWPGCYGFISVPESEEEIKLAEMAYPDAPVEAEKAWPEMVHRYFAGTLGILVAFIALVSVVNRRKAEIPTTLAVSLLALIILQAAFGMWTVTMVLLPIIVVLHLLGGFAMISLLLLLFLKIRDNNPVSVGSPLRNLALLGIVVVVAQVTLGGWTSANYAAIICEDFPTCQGHWIPPLDLSKAFQISTDGVTSYLGGHLGNDARVTIQWLHRLGALITVLYILFFVMKMLSAGFKHLALWLMAVLTMQVTLGISNVVFSLPLPVAVAHNGFAALLLISLVYSVHQLGLPENNRNR